MSGPKAYDDSEGGTSPLIREVPDYESTETSQLLGAGHQRRESEEAEVVWDGDKDYEGLPWWRRPSVFWLLGPFALFTLAFGGIMVPKLNLILSLVCRQHFADRNPQCQIPEIQAKVSTFILIMNFVTGALSAVIAPRLGRLSDRYGRTRLMAFASTGGLLGEILTVVIAKYADVIDYRWLILGSVFDGATGSLTAGSILSQSYTSDCTPPSKRAVYIGYTHACLFTGIALGPLLAGYLVKWTGSLLLIFYVVVGCHTVFILLLAFVIPESLVKSKREAAREAWAKEKESREHMMGSCLSRIQEVNPFEPLAILWPTGPGTSSKLRTNLVALAISDTIVLGSSIATGAVIILYSGYMFHWGTLKSSQFISALSFVRVFALLGVFPLINYFARVRPAQRREASGVIAREKNGGADMVDIWVMRVAILSDVVGVLGYIFARHENVFFASGMMTAFGGLGSATIQAVITKHVPQRKIGQILGATGMLHALCRVVGPVVFNGIYAATVKTYPQAFFVVLCALFIFAFLSTFAIRPAGEFTRPSFSEHKC
ncbi:major facilitator superfamily domain-containing protein [Emericellopsis atlantica]|uniref:Major facilitator superfamily domain-containing protein n=1 Tax=Emericellopsis atlantica TaxID=2614577 RepID=A0A9P7ZVS0_9HYPO|nr:major facilitator superfamily domain-containing protein [Emericellopsis atlantica]KAG9258956.1 major facilitator superfamily domain-containing protein [Emericellopsis atlantica]